MDDRTNPRIILTPELAREIYARKLALLTPMDANFCVDCSILLKGRSEPLSRNYNVSAKTVRDIWNRKTWTFATFDMWRAEEKSFHVSYPLTQVV